MTNLEALVADLTRLQAAATPGPWTWLPDDAREAQGWCRFGGEGSLNESGCAMASSAALIVASRNALPHLLARLTLLEAVAETGATLNALHRDVLGLPTLSQDNLDAASEAWAEFRAALARLDSGETP